jgi:hypothetical protein
MNMQIVLFSEEPVLAPTSGAVFWNLEDTVSTTLLLVSLD